MAEPPDNSSPPKRPIPDNLHLEQGQEDAREESERRRAQESFAKAGEQEQQRQDDERRREEARSKENLDKAAERNAQELIRQSPRLEQNQAGGNDYLAKLQEDARAPRSKDERERQDQSRSGSSSSQDIRGAGSRYSQALAQHYNIADPYASLARAAMAELALFRSEQQTLQRAIAAAKDPAARERLELRQQIEGYEYLAVTGDRIARQSEIITGRMNIAGRPIVNEEADRERKRAAEYREKATALRQEYRERQHAPASPRDRVSQPTKDNSSERSPSDPAVRAQGTPTPSRPETIVERNVRLIKEQNFAERARQQREREAEREPRNDGPLRSRGPDRSGPKL